MAIWLNVDDVDCHVWQKRNTVYHQSTYSRVTSYYELSPWLAGKQKPENEHTLELRIVEGGSEQITELAPCSLLEDRSIKPTLVLIVCWRHNDIRISMRSTSFTP
jgi:hypothetical protein